MSKKSTPKAAQVTISIAQAAALVSVHQQLDTGRVNHVGYLFHLISRPVPGDPKGRDLYAILRDTHPEALKHLGQLLAEWVDVSDAMTTRAQAEVDRISFGPPVPVKTEPMPVEEEQPTTH